MRSVRSLLLFFILCLFLGTGFAALSPEKFIAVFKTQEAPLSSVQKQVYYKKVLTNLSLLISKNRDDENQLAVFNGLKDYVKAQMQDFAPSTSPTVFFTLTSSGLSIPNVDFDKVRDVWLSLHNDERQNKSLTPFVYSFPLEGTASTWADHLAALGTTSHKRKSTDGYYSYKSIKTWFGNQGIVFDDEGQNKSQLFTENLGWNFYSCKKTDCTDDFIKAIKKSRTFFMSEKGRSYKPHYNAIVGDFTSIGLGVALRGNKYYLVAHYSQTLK